MIGHIKATSKRRKNDGRTPNPTMRLVANRRPRWMCAAILTRVRRAPETNRGSAGRAFAAISDCNFVRKPPDRALDHGKSFARSGLVERHSARAAFANAARTMSPTRAPVWRSGVPTGRRGVLSYQLPAVTIPEQTARAGTRLDVPHPRIDRARGLRAPGPKHQRLDPPPVPGRKTWKVEFQHMLASRSLRITVRMRSYRIA